MKKRESEMKLLEEQINKQNEKYSKIYDGESVSNTESIASSLSPNAQIENGVALLDFIFKNNIAYKKLIFLTGTEEDRQKQKRTGTERETDEQYYTGN